MGEQEKLLEWFLPKPADLKYDELRRLLRGFGYEELKTGRTSGSRIAFANRQTKDIIRLHRPHPKPNLRRYQIDLMKQRWEGKDTSNERYYQLSELYRINPFQRR
ncbi:MAG: type II toxin-antitoxin system HicA family toxin [Candidatus Marinimicrobia bacterium]|nr:type II toxin-antitoxin system HicA family toxin [Candidatus Neomarinimicrobiota bacterium]